ncbi:Dirigent protein 11 [Camellia lanceoleosa]|uniref:Dirigent protein 11 n=1 Tax=Camellia lanceoleosa TaxID=1840588 RepID=A0ACC0HV40_9ERIC|nr:Dirigent protein 11 [Camellia lanceoleosa]
MLPRIIFCIAVSLAILTVILLALFSPVTHRNSTKNHPNNTPSLALSLYIQQSQVPNPNPNLQPVAPSSDGALVFHRKLTEGPENTSKVVGTARGFIIPIQNFARSAFNIIYLTFDSHEYSGSVSVKAKNFGGNNKDRRELTVVGGTGSFAFARGLAVFSQAGQDYATYHVKLHLKFSNRSQTIPG